MGDFFNSLGNYLLSAVALGMTFLYGSTGETILEKAGHLNLGIPGVMCVGGAGGCLALQMLYPYRESMPAMFIVIIAILATFVVGAIMGALYSFLTVTLRSNQNVTGLAMTTFGVGAMKYMMDPQNITSIKYLYAKPFFRFPFDNMQNSLCYCGSMFFLAIAIALATSYVLFRTKVGLHLRAVGENAATADAAGINVTAYKYLSTCVGCGISALGGLYYIIDYSGSQEGYLSIEAFGWLAIALVIFALWKPHISIFGSAVFGILFIAGTQLPSLGITLPMTYTPIMKMLPYLVTIAVLIFTSIRDNKNNQPPASLGVNYFREER